jgi:AAA15 family ATPase/GTPase
LVIGLITSVRLIVKVSFPCVRQRVKKRFPDNFVTFEQGYDLLKTSVIVGENAGGKSNFINSLKFLKSLFASNEEVRAIHSYMNSVSLKEDESPKQKFEISFIAENGKIYEYAVEIDKMGIVAERLKYASKRKATFSDVFCVERTTDGVNYYVSKGKAITEIKTLLKNSKKNYGLFVSKLALLGNEDAASAVQWIMDKLYPESIFTEREADVKKQENDLAIIQDERYLDIFRMVDYSICGVAVDIEKPYSKSLIIRKDAEGNKYSRELQMDSTGVREFFVWAVQIFRVVYENKTVFADEMDRVLNPILSDRVIAFINGAEHNGQFIFSTHNVLHLDLKNYMKEQIYFITKDRDTLTSELYSLADFPEVRYETTKVYEFYMKGILGGTAFE